MVTNSVRARAGKRPLDLRPPFSPRSGSLAATQAQNLTAVVRKCHRVQHILLKQYDPALYNHMTGLGIEPQIYGM